MTSVIGSLAEIRPANWALTKKFEKYLKTPDTEVTAWQPELSYYVYLMNRLVDSKCSLFSHINFSQQQ